MEAYVGAKIIRAEPMTANQFERRTGKKPGGDWGDFPGYRVVYPDGYESWSPAATFENAYRPVTEGEAAIVAEG